MECKHCGAMLDREDTVCPYCGATVTEETAIHTILPVDETEEYEEEYEDEEYEDCEDESSASKPAPQKKKLALFALILALVIIAGAAAAIYFSREKAPYTGPMASDQYIVAQFKTHQLTNQTFQYYYWGQFYQLYQNYGSNISYLGLDLTKPFEEQPFINDSSRTWADFFTEYALIQWMQDMALMETAQAENFQLSESQQTDLQSTLDKLTTDATQNGFGSAEEYLKNSFDLSSDVASYNAYVTTSYTAGAYANQKYYLLYAQGMADPGDYKDIYCINIRHILIKFGDSTQTAKDAAKAQAEALYDSFKRNPTVDNFIALAKEHSADSSASAGGLIENVYPGQMVKNFEDWCFAEGRKAGDHGLVETEYGWHLMFFDGYTDKIYQRAAQLYADAKHTEWLEELTKSSPLTDYRDKITFRHAK